MVDVNKVLSHLSEILGIREAASARIIQGFSEVQL